MAKIHEFMSEVGKGNIFGQCDVEDFESAEMEKKKKVRKIKEEKVKRLEEMRRAEEEKRRQEIEDAEFAMEEQQRLVREELNRFPSTALTPRRTHGRGRAQSLWLDQERDRRDQLELSIYQREKVVKSQICQFAGGEGCHSNKVLKQFWHGDQVSASSTVDLPSEQFEDGPNDSVLPFNLSPRPESPPFQSVSSSSSASPVSASGPPSEASTLRSQASSYSPSLRSEASSYSPNFHNEASTLRAEASSYSPNFHNAASTLHAEASSFSPNFHNEASSLRSEASTLRAEASSFSPNLHSEASSYTPAPSNEVPRNTPRKRKSRLAAKFSNMSLDEEDKSEPVQQKDWFEITTLSEQPLTARPVRPRDYVSINDLRASHRVLHTPQQALFKAPTDFIYNEKEFPSL